MLLSFPRVTEMFQFTQFPLPALCVQAGVTPHYECGVSPFGYPRIDGWSAPSRGFSQPPTSFIGSHRQGIHRWPFVAWVSHYKDARARYEILKGRDGETNSPWKKGSSPLTRSGRGVPSQRKTGRAPGAHSVRLESSREGTDPDAGECVNWVSVSGTQRDAA